MIHAPKPHGHIAGDYFESFRTVYATPEQRLAKARRVFTPEGFGPETNPTRPALAMHWAEDDADLRRLAQLFYDTKRLVSNRVGRRVLGILKGDPANVDPVVGLKLVVGRISSQDPGFHMRPSAAAPDMAVCKVAIPIAAEQTIRLKHSGRLAITPPATNEGMLIYYASELSLAGDPVVYAETKQVEMPEVAYGDDQVVHIVEQLTAQFGNVPLPLAQ